jgi:hypothetical protein
MRYSPSYFFVLQLAIEEIINTTERTVPTIIAGNIWSADSSKNLWGPNDIRPSNPTIIETGLLHGLSLSIYI